MSVKVPVAGTKSRETSSGPFGWRSVVVGTSAHADNIANTAAGASQYTTRAVVRTGRVFISALPQGELYPLVAENHGESGHAGR
jgi:hypothetical protein